MSSLELAETVKKLRESDCFLLLIPSDIQIYLFQYFGPGDLCNISRTCKSLKQITEHETLWKRFGNSSWQSEALIHGWKKLYIKFLRTQLGYHLEKLRKKQENPNEDQEKKEAEKKLTQGLVEFPEVTGNEYDYLVKILVMGDEQVGKTSLIRRYVEDTFTEDYISTIGVDFKIMSTSIDNAKVKLQVWDTAGQERKPHNEPRYDVTNKNSFKGVNKWLEEIARYCSSENTEIALVGAKRELKNHQVTEEEAKEFVASSNHRISMFAECSNKKGDNVKEIFSALVTETVARLSGSSTPYLGGYYSQGWPSYVPSSEEIFRMVPAKNL